MTITCFILTFNEEKHIGRAIQSVKSQVDEVVVVDSFSSDRTVEISKSLGAKVLQNAWPGYSEQVNWAISQISENCDWLFRLDADEVLTNRGSKNLRQHIEGLTDDVDGLTVRRRIKFLKKEIRFGGMRNCQILRIFRSGKGFSEPRLMDEHIRVERKVVSSELTIVDENLNPISWLLQKYNTYSSLETAEVLNATYKFLDVEQTSESNLAFSAKFKRTLKHGVYLRLPPGMRATLYFLFRYFGQLGFLDGRTGFIYHLLQALVYRSIVDAKIYETGTKISENPDDLARIVDEDLGVAVKNRQVRK